MFNAKRILLERKDSSATQALGKRMYRFRDFLHFCYPLKLDFCRMTIDELTRMMDAVIREDQENPAGFRPIVAIGHTKDLVDIETIDSLLSYLEDREIRISTFGMVYEKCRSFL
jgi:hypothetical protein